jgi:hypothetical protein
LNIFTSFFNEKLASNLRVTSLPKQVNETQGLTTNRYFEWLLLLFW